VVFILGVIYLFWSHLSVFFRIESGLNIGPRGLLFDLGWKTFIDNPFGIGSNTSNLLVSIHPLVSNITGDDLHSFWLITLVEIGFIGFIYYLIISIFVLWKCSKRFNIFSKSLFCSYLGIITASIFHNTFPTFSIQLFILLFFCIAMFNVSKPWQSESIVYNTGRPRFVSRISQN